MVVLAVDVTRQRPGDRNVFGARDDRWKPPPLQEHIDDLSDRDASLAAQPSFVLVERQHPVDMREIDDPAAFQQCGITVASTHPLSQDR